MMAAKLAGYIDRSKFEVKFFVVSRHLENQIAETLRNGNVSVEYLNLSESFRFSKYRIFSKAMKAFSPDVIHCHLDVTYSWIWSIVHNKPLITTKHSDPYRWLDKRVTVVIKLKSLMGKLRVIGCSRLTKELVQKCYGLKPQQMGYIYNPVSVSDFTAAEQPEDCLEFVAMGRLHEVKNYPMMLRAFQRVAAVCHNVRLEIAGTGPDETALKTLAEELGISNKVCFLGNVQDIPGLLKTKHVLLLSSFSEACPMVILEAMASGLPIVATRVGGVPELVEGNGILVDNEDEDGFVEAMVKLAQDWDAWKTMAEESLRRSTRYDKGAIAQEYEREYLQVAKRLL